MCDLSSSSEQYLVFGPSDPKINLIQAKSFNLKDVVRIRSLKKSLNKSLNLMPISTDGVFVFDGKEKLGVADFLMRNLRSEGVLVVLTAKEYQLIFEQISHLDIRVKVLELEFPIFVDVKFNKSVHVQYKSLIKYIKRIDRIGLRAEKLSSQVSIKYQHKIERKVRFKKIIDGFFYFMDPSGFQDVFILKEARKCRKIIALDFNSMFLDCMRGRFPNPKNLLYEERNEVYEGGALDPGLYHVVFESPRGEFFKKFNPFKYKVSGNAFRLFLEDDAKVEILVSHDELCQYMKYFDRVFIVDSITSPDAISHPLLKSAESTYKKRLNYKRQGVSDLERLAKYEIQLMHSSTAINQKIKSKFDRASDLFLWLEHHYWINRPESYNSAMRALKNIFSRRAFDIKFSNEKLNLASPDIFSLSNVFSLSRNVVANSRVKMIKTLERLASFPGAYICYANVDSIHVSVPSNELEVFLRFIDDIVGESPGKLKIEAVADKGYWLDVGR